MIELYAQLGFFENPFSTFSAEEEKSFLKKVYVDPLFFNTIKSDLKKGNSRFIIGPRGIGKTALLMRLKETVSLEKSLAIIIDSFESIAASNNERDFLRLMIKKVITSFSFELARNTNLLNRLNQRQKEILSFVIKDFFSTISKSEYEKHYNRVDNYKARNWIIRLWNQFFNKPVNHFISGAIEVASESIRKSIGLPEPTSAKEFYKSYLPEIPVQEITPDTKNALYDDFGALKQILNDICEIIKHCSFNTTVIFFDKIDEYTLLNSSINSVVCFLEGLLKDTTILMNDNYSLAFSLWDVIRPELASRGVRFDKIKPVDITWQSDDLKEILEKRIRYFSKGTKSIKDIIPDDAQIDSIITLSNNSPRYIFRILSYIYDIQSNMSDSSTLHFSKEAIKKGQLMYAKQFDFYSLYPTNKGTNKDVVAVINKLLKLGKSTITSKDIQKGLQINLNLAASTLSTAQDYDLIREIQNTHATKTYKVKDPVIRYLITSNIKEIQ